MNTDNQKLLELRGLRTYFFTRQGVVKAVDDVSFTVEKGEVIGLVGESGCGKSITSLSILRMVPEPAGKIVGGKILFKNENLLEKSEEEMRQIRGNRISMILQDPMVALNQLLKIGYQLSEPLKYHGKAMGQIREKCIELLKKVRVSSPETRISEYPFQFSGGMCQRVVIGMGVSCEPDLLIADEPTTALDVTIQAQILRLLKRVKAEFNASIIIITHDLALAAQICTRVLVMYAGKIIEKAPVKVFYENSAHPYSNGLIRSVPVVGRRVERLYSIEGQPPSLLNPTAGCRFAPRCQKAKRICNLQYPPEVILGDGHKVACWLYAEE
ncbi:MAG: ABC transporter ATP-binding protein [Desulfobacterales bacterium]|nr:MAG: ABC transporter ATP-binding protein [Desulfobacterales bacterium]